MSTIFQASITLHLKIVTSFTLLNGMHFIVIEEQSEEELYFGCFSLRKIANPNAQYNEDIIGIDLNDGLYTCKHRMSQNRN